MNSKYMQHQINSELTAFIDFLIENNLTSKNKFNKKLLFENFNYYLNNSFNSISFKNKNVLDVGGGNGIYSFFAKICGANYVVCLEPSLDGSENDNYNYFEKIKKKFDFKNIFFENTTIQNFKTDKLFDLVILKDSINHLDEESCINLKLGDIYKKKYIKILKIIYNLMTKHSTIYISDCSSRNFFSDLGISNPFVREIEWFKHQEPEEWIKLIKMSNFKFNSLNWSSLNSLKFIDPFNNTKMISYFTSSNFRIIADKNEK
jgi:SAM-dependent methyltransferase